MRRTITIGLALAMITLGMPAIAGAAVAEENPREEIDPADAEVLDRETIPTPAAGAVEAHVDLVDHDLTLTTAASDSPIEQLLDPSVEQTQAAASPDDANCLTTEEDGWLNTETAANVESGDLPEAVAEQTGHCENEVVEHTLAEVTLTTQGPAFLSAVSWDFDAFGYFFVVCQETGVALGDATGPETTCEYSASDSPATEWGSWDAKIIRDEPDSGFAQVRAG